MSEDGEFVHRNFLQITRSGKRQPLHFDGGPLWYADENEKLWSPLSTIISLNDGVGTNVSGIQSVEFSKIYSKNSDPLAAGKSVLNYLKQCDAKSPNPLRARRNRAGQILAFHPGEQVHAGMGFNGDEDPLVPNLHCRIMLFLCFIPARFHARAWKLKLFESEYAWGLMKAGVSDDGITQQVRAGDQGE